MYASSHALNQYDDRLALDVLGPPGGKGYGQLQQGWLQEPWRCRNSL